MDGRTDGRGRSLPSIFVWDLVLLFFSAATPRRGLVFCRQPPPAADSDGKRYGKLTGSILVARWKTLPTR